MNSQAKIESTDNKFEKRIDFLIEYSDLINNDDILRIIAEKNSRIEGNKMTKKEYMENFTMEELVDRIVILDTFFKESNLFNSLMSKTEYPLEKSIKDNYESQIQQKEAKISRLEKEREELRNQRNEQMTIVNELKQKIKILEEQSKQDSSKTIADFIPSEPVCIAGMLINLQFECENNPLSKMVTKEETYMRRMFDVSELRQIAEHLLVYCNANGEESE